MKSHPHKLQQINENTSSVASLEDVVVESLRNIKEEWKKLPPSLVEEILTLFPGDSGGSP